MKKIFIFCIVFTLLIIQNFSLSLLKVYVATTPPFAYWERIDGCLTLKGIDVELLNYIATKLNFKYDLYVVSFQDLFNHLDKGDLFLGGIHIKPYRLELMYMVPYLNTTLVLLKRKGIDIDPFDLITFKNRTLGVKKGATGETWIKEQIEKNAVRNVKVISFESNSDILKAILNKEVDAGFFDFFNAAYYVKKGVPLELVKLSVYSSQIGIGISKNRPDLYKEISKIINLAIINKDIEKIYTKYIE